MPPKKAGKSKLPIPLPEGLVLKDTEGKNWRLGRLFAKGGFGLIYLAFPQDGTPVGDVPEHVIKVEYLENGTLFSELKFYQRAAKPESIKKWKVKHKLDFLGIPSYWGSGLAEYNGKSYRFMVMDRMGDNLKQTQPNSKFPREIVKKLGIQILDVLEYIHENEYVHGDIKAENIMLGYMNPEQVYLADYGLSYRYCPDGTHKQYNENPKKGHNGTIEFTSRDAHKGVALSRRSDLEILAYCILKWLCGKLPWERNLTDPVAVQTAKTKFMEQLPDSLTCWVLSESCNCDLAQFFTHVRDLAYDEKPNYKILKQVLLDGLESAGARSDSLLRISTGGRGLNMQKPKDLKVNLPNLNGNVKHRTQNKIKAKEANEKNVPETINHNICRQVQEKKPADKDNTWQDNWSKEKAKQRSTYQYPPLILPKGEQGAEENSLAYCPECLCRSNQDDQNISQNTFSAQGRADIYRYSSIIILLIIGILVSLYCF